MTSSKSLGSVASDSLLLRKKFLIAYNLFSFSMVAAPKRVKSSSLSVSSSFGGFVVGGDGGGGGIIPSRNDALHLPRFWFSSGSDGSCCCPTAFWRRNFGTGILVGGLSAVGLVGKSRSKLMDSYTGLPASASGLSGRKIKWIFFSSKNTLFTCYQLLNYFDAKDNALHVCYVLNDDDIDKIKPKVTSR